MQILEPPEAYADGRPRESGACHEGLLTEGRSFLRRAARAQLLARPLAAAAAVAAATRGNGPWVLRRALDVAAAQALALLCSPHTAALRRPTFRSLARFSPSSPPPRRHGSG